MASRRIEFMHTADTNALDIVVEGERIGSLQHHPERSARVVLNAGTSPLVEVSVEVLEQVVGKSHEIQPNR